MWNVYKADALGVWLTDLTEGKRRHSWPADGSFLDMGAAILLCDNWNMRDYGKLNEPFTYDPCPPTGG